MTNLLEHRKSIINVKVNLIAIWRNMKSAIMIKVFLQKDCAQSLHVGIG
jgi:hypothetical protein